MKRKMMVAAVGTVTGLMALAFVPGQSAAAPADVDFGVPTVKIINPESPNQIRFNVTLKTYGGDPIANQKVVFYNPKGVDMCEAKTNAQGSAVCGVTLAGNVAGKTTAALLEQLEVRTQYQGQTVSAPVKQNIL